MNRKIGMVSAAVNLLAVAAFALCMPFGFMIGNYLSSMFIAFSFVPLICALVAYGKPEASAAGYAAMAFAAMYGTVILLVYFAQVTTVRLETLDAQAASLLDFQRFGLFFHYDLLGYCFMALATFFAGLTLEPRSKLDKALRNLLLIHGIFAISCFLLPMLDVFGPDMQGAEWIGTLVLEFWCLYFMPVGVLAFLHFKTKA